MHLSRKSNFFARAAVNGCLLGNMLGIDGLMVIIAIFIEILFKMAGHHGAPICGAQLRDFLHQFLYGFWIFIFTKKYKKM